MLAVSVVLSFGRILTLFLEDFYVKKQSPCLGQNLIQVFEKNILRKNCNEKTQEIIRIRGSRVYSITPDINPSLPRNRIKPILACFSNVKSNCVISETSFLVH